MNTTNLSPEQGVFPHFKDGDLLIILNGSRQYQLHSTMLRSISSRIKDLCSTQGGAKLTSKAIKRGMVIRYRMLMVANDGEGDNVMEGVPSILMTMPLDGDGKPTIPCSIGLDLENGVGVPPIIRVSVLPINPRRRHPIDAHSHRRITPCWAHSTASPSILEIIDKITCPTFS